MSERIKGIRQWCTSKCSIIGSLGKSVGISMYINFTFYLNMYYITYDDSITHILCLLYAFPYKRFVSHDL